MYVSDSRENALSACIVNGGGGAGSGIYCSFSPILLARVFPIRTFPSCMFPLPAPYISAEKLLDFFIDISKSANIATVPGSGFLARRQVVCVVADSVCGWWGGVVITMNV